MNKTIKVSLLALGVMLVPAQAHGMLSRIACVMLPVAVAARVCVKNASLEGATAESAPWTEWMPAPADPTKGKPFHNLDEKEIKNMQLTSIYTDYAHALNAYYNVLDNEQAPIEAKELVAIDAGTIQKKYFDCPDESRFGIHHCEVQLAKMVKYSQKCQSELSAYSFTPEKYGQELIATRNANRALNFLTHEQALPFFGFLLSVHRPR